ncbi:MAG: DUF411 domain-containing protein [Pyrobaculum sp.]
MRKVLIIILAGVILGSLWLTALFKTTTQKAETITTTVAAPSVAAIFYYAPPCGCCETYLPKLKSITNVEIKIVNSEELFRLKQELGIPKELWSCHTIIIDKYFVEGHVPISAVKNLIEGKMGDVRGLALPHRETDTVSWEGPGYYMVELGGKWRRVGG